MASKQSTPASGRRLTKEQLAARRANARKSTGPKTPQGKARSSKNALKHGVFAQTALLSCEPNEEFVALRDSYLAEYQPQGPTETHFVMEMANAQWRLRRVRGMEADLIDHLIDMEIDPVRFTPGQRQAEALRRLADDSHALVLLQRYEVMFRRQYERALRMLWEHRDRHRCPASHHPPQRQDRPPQPDNRSVSPSNQPPVAAPSALSPAPPPGANKKLQNEPKPHLSDSPEMASPLVAEARTQPPDASSPALEALRLQHRPQTAIDIPPTDLYYGGQ